VTAFHFHLATIGISIDINISIFLFKSPYAFLNRVVNDSSMVKLLSLCQNKHCFCIDLQWKKKKHGWDSCDEQSFSLAFASGFANTVLTHVICECCQYNLVYMIFLYCFDHKNYLAFRSDRFAKLHFPWFSVASAIKYADKTSVTLLINYLKLFTQHWTDFNWKNWLHHCLLELLQSVLILNLQYK